jgi:hypothetical protein
MDNLAHCYGNKYTDGKDIYFLTKGIMQPSTCEIEMKRNDISPSSKNMSQDDWRNKRFAK